MPPCQLCCRIPLCVYVPIDLKLHAVEPCADKYIYINHYHVQKRSTQPKNSLLYVSLSIDGGTEDEVKISPRESELGTNADVRMGDRQGEESMLEKGSTCRAERKRACTCPASPTRPAHPLLSFSMLPFQLHAWMMHQYIYIEKKRGCVRVGRLISISSVSMSSK